MIHFNKLILTSATILGLALFNFNISFSQTDSSSTKKSKPSKADRIWLLAYDDTTRAIATLFLVKQKISNQGLRTDYLIAGISAAVLVTGGMLILTKEPSNDPESYDHVPIILGAFGLIGSGLSMGINLLWFSPYTLRKYRKLIEMHKSGKPLPEFYQQKIKKHRLL